MNLQILLEELYSKKEDPPHMQNDTFTLFPNLAAAMSDRGITQKQLAGTLGISRSSLGRRLRGNIEFRWNELLRLHSIFPDMPVSILLKKKIIST